MGKGERREEDAEGERNGRRKKKGRKRETGRRGKRRQEERREEKEQEEREGIISCNGDIITWQSYTVSGDMGINAQLIN